MSAEPSLFDLYFEYTKRTEPAMFLHRWSLLPTVGAWLGRQFYFPFGDSKIHPNLYVMMVGDPGSRKSTAIKMAKRLMGAAGYEKFAADKTTKEKFLLDLEGVEGDFEAAFGAKKEAGMETIFTDSSREAREVFIVADEFNEFMGTGNIDFLSLLGNFWDYDDDNTPYTYRLKNSRSVAIWNPTVSLLGGNTHESFAACFPPAAMGQGFLSRLILVAAEPSGQKITFPQKPPEELRLELIKRLQAIKIRVSGEAKITTKAAEALHVIYTTHEGLDDMRFKHYSTRRFTQLIRLCLICCACRLSCTIEVEDVLLANTILTYTEHKMPQALGEYGKAKNMQANNNVIAFLKDHRQPQDISDIWKAVQTDLDRIDDLIKIMHGLRESGKVQWVEGKTSAARGYLLVRKVIDGNTPYVNFNLLQEHKS